MFILALNSLSLTPGTKPSDFPLVLFLPGLAYRDQVLKENAPHFILAHSIPKKKKKRKTQNPQKAALLHSQILQPGSKCSPPHLWGCGGILFIVADHSLTVKIRGNGWIQLEEPGDIKPQVSPAGASLNTWNCREALHNSKESLPKATTH